MRHLWLLAVAALLVGACGTAAPATAAPQAVTSGVAAPPASAPAAPAAPGTPAAPAAAPLAAFLAMPLTDVRSGERFTLGDFKGKVTIVEGMAVW